MPKCIATIASSDHTQVSAFGATKPYWWSRRGVGGAASHLTCTTPARTRWSSACRGVQAEKAGARWLKGPHTFALERLLSVFWALLRAEADTPLTPQAEASADILCLVSTLVTVRLLSQVRSAAGVHEHGCPGGWHDSGGHGYMSHAFLKACASGRAG